uniref:endo-1,4-beta-xylanase n=1 Tax=uncultured bacterium contig00069 TaxID=1181550 RepID=A0A806KLN2_9BACT|nr:endo-1,4-beta-xylanase precursor [uncultured bacterium contig00069]
MKKLVAFSFIAAFFAPLFAQQTMTSNGTRNYNGYDYELWKQEGVGNTSMTLTGDNGSGTNAKGGTFEATWSGTINVLFRSGKKWTSNGPTFRELGNITIDFIAEWTSGDNVKMLGVYGWAYYANGSQPSGFNREIEYYIIQDRGSYNSASQGRNATKKGEATIDGILYEFYICDRINEASITGNGQTFKQFFSVPKNTSSHRQRGLISVSEHFKEWAKVGMDMNGSMYEVAMKVESYTGSTNGNGSAKVTKNILCIGSGCGGGTSSSSTGGGGTSSSSRASSSSSTGSSPSQAQNCNNYIGTLPANPNPPANPYTACFSYNGNCYVCKIDNEGDGNTCASTWVWSGNYLDDNIANNYWYQSVTCPVGSSSSRASSSSVVASSSSSRPSSSSAAVASSSSSRPSSSSVSFSSSSATTAFSSSSSIGETPPSSSSEATPIRVLHTIPSKFRVRSLNNGTVQVESNADIVIYLYDGKGNMAQKIDVPTGSSIVKLSVPTGIYIVKNGKTKENLRIMVR